LPTLQVARRSVRSPNGQQCASNPATLFQDKQVTAMASLMY
jgi:hypothetical protein